MGEARRRQMQGPRNINMNVPVDQLKDRVCDCGGLVFTAILALKEIPALYSPSGKPETMMAPLGFMCVVCGKNMTIRPEEPKPEEEKQESSIIIPQGSRYASTTSTEE